MLTTEEKKAMAIEMLDAIDRILSDNGIWYSLSYGSALGAYREHGFIEWDLDIDIIVKIDDQDYICDLLRRNLPEGLAVASCKSDNVSSYDVVLKEGVPERDLHVDIYPLVGGPDDIEAGYKYQLKCRKTHKYCSCKYVELGRLRKKWKLPFVIAIKVVEKLIPNRLIRSHISKMANRYPLENAKYIFPFANDGKRGEYMEKDKLLKTRRVQFESLELPIPAEAEWYLSRIYGDNFMTPIKYFED